jgi:hypothetical protein
MRAFVPSEHSGPAADSEDYGWVQAVSAGIGVVGQVASVGIGAVAGRKAQASQQRHEKSIARGQEELIALQTQQVRAQVDATRAAGALQKGGIKKTMLIVGSVLLGVSMIAGAIVISKRPPAEEYEE